MKKISISVDRKIFENSENGFVVFLGRLKGKDFTENREFIRDDGTIAVKGTLSALYEKMCLEAEGDFVEDTEYEGQARFIFQASSFRPYFAETKDLVRFLSGKNFPCITKDMAERIAEQYGTCIFDQPLDYRLHDFLLSLKVRSDKLETVYRKLIYLSNYYYLKSNFPALDDRIISILAKLGDGIMARISEDPYGICKEYVISPVLADDLGKFYGVESTDRRRVDYMIHASVRAFEGKGHTRFEYNTFKLFLHDMLSNCHLEDIPDDLILPELPEAVPFRVNGDYRLQYDGSTLFVQSVETYKKEKTVADELHRISGIHEPIYDLGKALKETADGINYCDRQKDVLRYANVCNFLIVTGGPGTGKTATISKFIRLVAKYAPSMPITLCAPTGKAAKRLAESSGRDAGTIHSTFKIRPFSAEAEDDSQIECGVVIIDEVSMLDLDVCATMLPKIPTGSILIFCGDHNQLESVGKGAIMRDLVAGGTYPTVKLEAIFRQSGRSGIIDNAQRLLKNDSLSSACEDFYICEEESRDILLEEIKTALRLYDPSDVQLLAPYKATEKIGVKELNKALEPILNTMTNAPSVNYGDSTFRVGDRIIFNVNNSEEGYCNGETGKIAAIGEDSVKIITDCGIYDLQKRLLKDVSLSYALTVHKAQGSEKKVVFLVLPDDRVTLISKKIVYTAVTRARSDMWVFAQNGVLSRLNRIWRQQDYRDDRRLTGLKQLLLSH